MRAAPPRSPHLMLCCVLLALVCAVAGGCAHHQRCCVPTNLLVPESTVDLNSTSDHQHSGDRDALSASLAHIKKTAIETGPEALME